MTLHAVKENGKGAACLSNELIFNCEREELLKLIEKGSFGRSVNYRLMVAIPPEREKTKKGIFLPGDQSTTEQFKTSVGRVISRGSTVGDNPSLRDCKDIEIGDYVKFNFHAAGLPEERDGVLVKHLCDDQVMCIEDKPDALKRLYDY